jgi:hypothetical protein
LNAIDISAFVDDEGDIYARGANVCGTTPAHAAPIVRNDTLFRRFCHSDTQKNGLAIEQSRMSLEDQVEKAERIMIAGNVLESSRLAVHQQLSVIHCSLVDQHHLAV